MPYSDREKYLENQQSYYQKRKENNTFGKRLKLESLSCLVCSKVFIQTTPQQKYCSVKCNKKSPAAQEAQKQHKLKNKEKYKEYALSTKVKKYGIDKKVYLEMQQTQQHCCKICGVHEKDTKQKELCIDHNHVTKAVRGLLCHSCNVALGFFKDDVSLLLKAIKYVETEGNIL